MRTSDLALTIAVGVAATPSAALAQQLGRAAEFEPPIVRLALGLLLCTLVALVAALTLRRFLSAKGRHVSSVAHGGSGKLRVIETRRLSANADLCLIACEEREYLVIVSAAGATLLDALPAQAGTPG